MVTIHDESNDNEELPNGQLWSVVQDVVQRRHSGEIFSDEEVIEQHPHLAPDLEHYLQRAKRISKARTHASSRDEMADSEASRLSDGREVFPRKFGKYSLVSLIFRGGMGAVYRAIDNETDRTVALKMIRGHGFATPEAIDRFRNESESMAALSHKNVVTVYEVGTCDRQHYYAMEFIEGESLAELISRAPLPGAVAADLMIAIVDAVATAHQHGIIHRDLKPSNVIVDLYGNPYISDFGLAKQLNRDSGTTQTGQVIGSASYMSPEQALGKHDVVDELSDVYGLGAILYEMLTRRAPFSAESIPLTLLQVIKDVPISPRALNRNIAVDLETVCLKCLDKRPSRRYESALELKKDLQRWRLRKTITASPITVFGRAARWVRSDPRLAVAVCIAGLFFLSILGALAWGNWQTGLALDQAKRSAHSAKRSLYLTHMNLAQRAWGNGNINYATSVLSRYQDVNPADDLRGFEWHYLWRLAHQTSASVETADVWLCCDYVSDGEQLLVAGTSGEVRRYDARNHKQLDRIDAHEDWIRDIAVSGDGRKFATACYDGSMQIRDVKTGELIQELVGHRNSEETHVNSVAFADASNRLISAGRDGTIREWDLTSGEELPRRFVGHTDRINDMCFCAATNRLATASRNKQVFLWNYASGELLKSYSSDAGEWNASYVQSVLLLSHCQQVVTTPSDGVMLVWDSESGELLKTLHSHCAGINAFAISPDGSQALASSTDGSISVWELPEWDLVSVRRGHRRAVKGVEFISNDQFVSVGEGGSIHWWGNSQELDVRLDGHGDTVWSIDVSDDGKVFASCGSDGRMCLWSLPDHQLIGEVLQTAEVNAVSFSSDSSMVATGCDDGIARVFRVADQKLMAELSGHQSHVTDVDFFPNSILLASGSRDGTARLWNTETKEEIREFKIQAPGVVKCRVTKDGKYLLTSGSDAMVRKWAVDDGDLIESRKLHTDQVRTLNISADGHKFVTAGRDGKAIVWSTYTMVPLRTIEADIIQVKGTCFSPNGESLATCGGDTNIKLWDLETGDQRAIFRSFKNPSLSLAFTPDGNGLISGEEGRKSKITIRYAKTDALRNKPPN